VTNIGTAYLDSVEVNDPELGVVSASIGALAPGETKTITMQSSTKVEVVSIPEVTGFSVVPGTQQRIGVQMRLSFAPSLQAEDEAALTTAATTDEEDAEYMCL
jgi:hypothetical protein